MGTEVAQEVDRLNGKLKAMENDHIEQTRKTEEYKGNLQEKSSALTNALQQVERFNDKIKVLERDNFKQSRDMKEYKTKFQETSNALTNAREKVDKLDGKVKSLEIYNIEQTKKLNCKVKSLEIYNIEQTKKTEEYKTTVRKLTAEILEKRIAVKRLQARAIDVEEANQKCTKNASVLKSAFEERIQELEMRLVALDKELQRQKSGAGQGNLDVLQKSKEALMKVNAENSSLIMRLKEIEKRRMEEEEDHVAEVEGYEEAIREKNEAIRDLSEKVKTLEGKQASPTVSGMLRGNANIPISG